MLVKNKKASLELSIRTIVVVVLAMTLLGLGLSFIRGMFKDIESLSGDVSAQVREKILDDLITGDKKISFPKTEIWIDKGKSEIITVGIRNKRDTDLEYYIEFRGISDPNGDPFDLDKWFQYAPKDMNDAATIPPADYDVRNIRLTVPLSNVNQGSYFVTFNVIDVNDPDKPYATKDFFIVVRS
jgi:hypothetical protein